MSFQNAKIICTGADPAKYHTRAEPRGSLGFVMGVSQLREFQKCPDRWLRGYNPPDSTAKEFGSLLDCIALTPKQFPVRYAVQPESYFHQKDKIEKDWHNGAS